MDFFSYVREEIAAITEPGSNLRTILSKIDVMVNYVLSVRTDLNSNQVYSVIDSELKALGLPPVGPVFPTTLIQSGGITPSQSFSAYQDPVYPNPTYQNPALSTASSIRPTSSSPVRPSSISSSILPSSILSPAISSSISSPTISSSRSILPSLTKPLVNSYIDGDIMPPSSRPYASPQFLIKERYGIQLYMPEQSEYLIVRYSDGKIEIRKSPNVNSPLPKFQDVYQMAEYIINNQYPFVIKVYEGVVDANEAYLDNNEISSNGTVVIHLNDGKYVYISQGIQEFESYGGIIEVKQFLGGRGTYPYALTSSEVLFLPEMVKFPISLFTEDDLNDYDNNVVASKYYSGELKSNPRYSVSRIPHVTID